MINKESRIHVIYIWPNRLLRLDILTDGFAMHKLPSYRSGTFIACAIIEYGVARLIVYTY